MCSRKVVYLQASGDAALDRWRGVAHLEVDVHPRTGIPTSVHRLSNTKLDQRLVDVVRLRWAVGAFFAVNGAACFL